MPIIKLKGLPGLNRLSAKERTRFILSNEDKLRQFEDDPDAYDQAAEILYNNQLFKKHFGEEGVAFAKANNIGYEQRNAMLTEKVVSDVFTDRFSPWNMEGTQRDNKKGLGADYEKYASMPTEFKQKLLESGYLSPSEFDEAHKDDFKGLDTGAEVLNWITTLPTQVVRTIANAAGVEFVDELWKAFAPQENLKALVKEGINEYNKRSNDNILQNIYSEAGDNMASKLGSAVSQFYYDPDIVGKDDEDTKRLFKEAITPSRATGNMGIPEYASHYGVVEGEGISSEMEDFSIDDMREVLAKKAVYDRYMTPDMAMTVLNNEAKRYIHDHQGFGKKAAMFAKDVLIASSSYTVDKVNGFYNLGLMAADELSKTGALDTPTVWIDIQGNVVDTSKNKLFRDTKGNVYYTDENGQRLGVHQEQIDRTTLHNMGRNMDGTEDTSILNPQDWTRREQFGVWDKDIAKQYEQIGSSPYKVAYNPNDDRDLLYESFKMMSFGLADTGAQLIPFGIGAAGKALSTASKLGNVVQKLGSAINTASKFLTAETRVGQVAQGTAGALGIAEAYQRGAFQETLAQNIANLEQIVTDMSVNEIRGQYNEDENYRKQIDVLANVRFEALKAQKLASMGEDERVVDEQKLDEALKAEALNQVIGEAIQDKINEHKNSDDYATMQERAINSAGLAATNTFWPEAIKYGLVNTVGFRKFLYTTPTSLAQKASKNFKGLREITTSAGRKRLATDIGKTVTNAEKWKNFGKVAGSQVWGGAWTNGTDDMMVDAAERVNEDSFNRYLHDYETGEGIADTYGFTDGLWSYWMGLGNSLGQETTAEAALVGGLGSSISGNLHFTNIASLATKEGREAFRNNFQQRYKRNDDGTLVKGEDGKPIVEQIGWRENWRDRLGFFIQNGVLNEYYGKKQNLRNLQDHADYVNNILDDMDDFKSIESLISSNIGRENALNIGDEKTMRFVQAFNAVHALEQLGRDEKDPSTLSSVVMRHKDMIEKASKLGTEDSDMTEEEVNSLLGQYYSNNPGLAQTEENNQIALQNIAQNARKLQEAYQAYNEAEESIQSVERDMGAPIVPAVRFRMKMSQALDGHWRDRLQTMKDEVEDTSSDVPTEGEALIAAVGGKRKADRQLKDFAIQENVLLQGVSDAVSQQQKMLDEYNRVQQTLRNAEENGDSEAILQAQKDLKEAKDNYDESIEERMFREDMLSSAREKQQRLQDAVDAWEKGTKSKVLSADEIMSLDPVTRAKMMRELEVNPFTGEREADPYSAAQRKQIEKLKARLKAQDKTGDPLQKIQDIALLTQRIAQNEDAYHRLSRNPDAAAVQLEKQQKEAAEKAVDLINHRNAETLADYILQMDYALAGRKDIKQRQIDDYVYRTLRNKNTTLLDIIEENNLLTGYLSQVQKAKEWAHVTSDIDAVLSNMDRDETQSTAIRKDIDRVIESATSREEIITNLERAIDNSSDAQRQKDYEELLDGLQKLGYQRNATVIENRKQRKEREEAQRKAEEDRKKQLEAAVKEAEAKKAAEDAKKKAEEEEKKKGNDDGISSTQAEQDKLLEGKMGVDLGDLGFEDEVPASRTVGTLAIEEIDVPTTTGGTRKARVQRVKYSDIKKGDIIWYSGPSTSSLTGKMLIEGIDNGEAYSFDGFIPKNRTYYREVKQPSTGSLAEGAAGTVAEDVAETKEEKASEPIDVLVAWAEGRISREDAIKQLDGTDYVKHTKGNPALGTKDGVHLSNKVEWELGKYVTEKYPFLSYGNVSVATGVSTFGGNMNLTVIKDAEGNEYGTPSNFLRSLATNPKGRVAEAVKKGLEAMQQGKSNIDELVELWEIYSALGTKDIPKTLNDIGYQMVEIREAERIFKEKHPDGVPEMSEEEAKELAKVLGIQQFPETSVTNTVEVHDDTLGDVIQGKSPTLEEQMVEAQRKGQGEVQDVTGLPNSDKENSRGEDGIETPSAPLNGVSMNEWVINKDTENAKHIKIGSPVRYEKDLQHDHVLVHKKGGKEGDSMNQFYEWLNNASIKLQNIIDDELSQILTQNPHTPVMFMRLRPTGKVGDFRDDTLMLVVEYNSDVQKAHNDGNGGVITSDGKKYLIVGTVGYGDKEKNPDKFNLWKKLMDNHAPDSHKLKIKAWDWFKQDAHKHELYYIHPDFHTEIVPNSMIPGYLIRQNEVDKTEQERSISELLNDKERNPHGYKLDDLGWAIQNMTSFWTTNTGGKMVMAPEHTIDNLGRVFVLVPAGNGKLMPAKIEPLHYADGMDENGNIVNSNALNRDSVLWKRIQDLLNQLTSPRYEDRQSAIKQLPMLLYFVPKDQGNKTILIGTDEHDNRVTVVNGAQRTTFLLDSNFNREEFFRAVREMNPRINVTPNALTNKERLRELEEIGALKTDIAKLGTCGVSYTIYGIDSDGNMVISERPVPTGQEVQSGNSENNVREFRYLYGNNYKYNIATGEFTKDGVPVTGDDMIEYAYKIGTQQVVPIKQEGVWQYYIISTGANPEVVRQNSIGRIEQLSKDEAQKVIDDEIARVAEEKRKWALEQALAEQQSNEENEPVPTIDEEGSLRFFEEENTVAPNRKPEENQATTPQPLTPDVSVEGLAAQRGTRTFKQLWRSSDRNKLLDVLRQKDWENVPMEDMGKLKKYLEDKGMQNLDMVGTSAVDYEAWLQKLRCL